MSENGIRLGCHRCDRDDYDGVSVIPSDWRDGHQIQSLEAARTELHVGDQGNPFGWQTHLGTCPDCQQEDEPNGS